MFKKFYYKVLITDFYKKCKYQFLASSKYDYNVDDIVFVKSKFDYEIAKVKEKISKEQFIILKKRNCDIYKIIEKL